MGKTFFVLIDVHSKWIDAVCTNSPSAAAAIEHHRTIFSQFGIPETIVSDNAACVTEEELSKILFAYRITPQATTGVSHSELLLSRRPRCRLDLVKYNIRQIVENKQLSQKINHDTTTNVRSFHIDDQVLVKNFHNSGRKWLQSQIIKSVGPLPYLIILSDGPIFCRHIDHLRKYHIPQYLKYVVNNSIPDFSDVIFLTKWLKMTLIVMYVDIHIETDVHVISIDLEIHIQLDIFMHTHLICCIF